MHIRNLAARINEQIKTGQTVSYHAGDDGDLELGLDHNYEVKTTGDQSGTTAIIINGKTHNLSNNTVIDHAVRINGKQLEWVRYVPTADIGPDNNGKLFWTDAANGEDIWAFLQQANANSLGGHSDWRIPNYHELLSISDIGHCNPAIDTTAFPSTPSYYHWTASTNPCDTASAFYVYFFNINASSGTKEVGKYYVRLVRH